MQGADRVNDEFEVGYNENFERNWERAEIVGRVVMVAVIAAGLAGFFGRGPYSHQTKHTAESALTVDFEPIARSQAPTQVTFHIDNPTDAPLSTCLSVPTPLNQWACNGWSPSPSPPRQSRMG